jgi:hypothetical protein
MGGHDTLFGRRPDGSEIVGVTAFVTTDNANCLYEPKPQSAVKFIPPYGTEVQIIRDAGSWVLIRFYDKAAWSPRTNLSAALAPKRPAVDVGVVPVPNYTLRPPPKVALPAVEYGPRGGRFVRTSTGFRRYF